MPKVEIRECTSQTELYCQYSGQFEPQAAYIELDLRNATLSATYNAEVGNAIPFSVYHGQDIRFPVPILTGNAANRLMREIAPLADRMLADWEDEWDGNNMVAVYGDDARAALAEIQELLGIDNEYGPGDTSASYAEEDLVGVWDLDSATNGNEVDDYDITADTTDERLEEIEQEILTSLKDCGVWPVAVCDGLLTHLKNLRNDLEKDDEE